jgi:hypothetical protein
VRRRLGLAVLALAASAALAPAAAQAAWVSSGAGSAFAKAQALPTGSAPAVSVTNRNVTVTWTASTLPGGAGVDGYTVRRYDASTQTLQTIGADCAGTVTALTCTETVVPGGTWRYTVTPRLQAWVGGESALSSSAAVGSPSLDLSPTTVTALPAALTGTVSSFAEGETLVFRLDDPVSGTVLSGSSTPTAIPAGGGASVSVTIPAGVANGTHTVYAVGSAGSTAGADVAVAVDTQAPTIGGAAIAKSQGGTAGYLKQAGTYYVYANVTDDGLGASGVATVTADVSSLTTGQTAVALTAGSYTAGGQSYGYRSALLTVGNPKAAGSYSFSIAATDNKGNAGGRGGFAVTVDNTAPAASTIQTTNVAGGTTGKAETGDTITFTFSEVVDAESVLAGWSGGATTVTLRLVNGGGGNDSVQIWNGANTAQLPLGTVNLGSTAHVTANVSFTGSTMTQSGAAITITLGTPSGATTRAGNARMNWTPSATATDRAANACSTTALNEAGGNDRDF